jgi:hypothetical protein
LFMEAGLRRMIHSLLNPAQPARILWEADGQSGFGTRARPLRIGNVVLLAAVLTGFLTVR